MCAALMFRRFNVPAARRRPTFRRWITPGYDPGRDSLFLFFLFLFFIFYHAPPAQRRSRNDQAATTERRDTPPLRRKESPLDHARVRPGARFFFFIFSFFYFIYGALPTLWRMINR